MKIIRMIVVIFVFYVMAFLFLNRQEETNIVMRKPAQNDLGVTPNQKSSAALLETHQAVERKNLNEQTRLQQFLADGWVLADSFPPDLRVQTLDPQYLNSMKLEYQNLMSTNTFSGTMLNAVHRIAIAAEDERTRIIAIENLGRSTDNYAQTLLIDLFNKDQLLQYRSDILQQILPKKDSPKSIQFLIDVANSQGLDDSLQEQAISSLVIAVAMDQRGRDIDSHSVFTALSSENQVLFRKQYNRMMGH